MLIIEGYFSGERSGADCVRLTYDDRQRSRMLGKTLGGLEFHLALPRGSSLRGGDRLISRCGTVVLVQAADEALCRVDGLEGSAFARAAYHLGNRHVPTEIGEDWLSFQRDPILADMLRGLGFTVRDVMAPFEAEKGAYHGHHGSSAASHGSAESRAHHHD